MNRGPGPRPRQALSVPRTVNARFLVPFRQFRQSQAWRLGYWTMAAAAVAAVTLGMGWGPQRRLLPQSAAGAGPGGQKIARLRAPGRAVRTRCRTTMLWSKNLVIRTAFLAWAMAAVLRVWLQQSHHLPLAPQVLLLVLQLPQAAALGQCMTRWPLAPLVHTRPTPTTSAVAAVPDGHLSMAGAGMVCQKLPRAGQRQGQRW